MNREQALRQVFARTFNISPEEVGPGTGPSSIGAWDSLGQLRLIMEVEETFGVDFSMDEVVTLDSFGKILAALDQKVP
jgi:acyl carrier protein